MRLSIVTLFLSLLFSTTTSLAQDNASQLFAYVERLAAAELVIVDPAVSLSHEVARYDYPVPIGWSVGALILHELNSELWSFAILQRGYADTMFYIANLKTGFAREILIGGYYVYNPEIVWSPDGQKVAFIASMLETERKPGLDIYVYDLTTDELKPLTDSNLRYAGLSWSSDSRELATFSHYCEVLEYCEEETRNILHIFDIKTGLVTDRLVLPQKFTLPCDPVFSPQDDFVAFTSHCDRYIVGWFAHSDVYLYKRHSQTITQITTFGEVPEGSIEKYPFYAIYNYTWLDDRILLVGADYRNISQEKGQQLLRYRVNATTESLSHDIGAGFEVIPSTNHILVRSRSPQFVLNPELHNEPIEAFLISKDELKTSDDLAESLQPILFPLTQPLNWSRDRTRAYSFVLEPQSDGYSTATGEIAFFNAMTQDIHIDRLPADQEDVMIIPVGWISSEALP